MAQIKRIFYEDRLVYPLTITDAVLDPNTGEQLSVTIRELKKHSYDIIPNQEIIEMIEQ